MWCVFVCCLVHKIKAFFSRPPRCTARGTSDFGIWKANTYRNTPHDDGPNRVYIVLKCEIKSQGIWRTNNKETESLVILVESSKRSDVCCMQIYERKCKRCKKRQCSNAHQKASRVHRQTRFSMAHASTIQRNECPHKQAQRVRCKELQPGALVGEGRPGPGGQPEGPGRTKARQERPSAFEGCPIPIPVPHRACA